MHTVPIDHLNDQQRNLLLTYLLEKDPTAVEHVLPTPSTELGKTALEAASEGLSLAVQSGGIAHSIDNAMGGFDNNISEFLFSTVAEHCDALSESMAFDILSGFESHVKEIWTTSNPEMGDQFDELALAQAGESVRAAMTDSFFDELDDFFQNDLPRLMFNAMQLHVDDGSISSAISTHIIEVPLDL